MVPLEYGSAARSRAGSMRTAGAGASVASSVANGVVPAAAPKAITSVTPALRAAGAARSRNGATVTSNRAVALRS